MVIRRDSLKPPTLPKETLNVPELGGDVVIRGPMASARIALQRTASSDGNADLAKLAPVLLASSVLDCDEQPLFSEQQWEVWGGGNYTAYLGLFNAVMRLWGFDREESKKN